MQFLRAVSHCVMHAEPLQTQVHDDSGDESQGRLLHINDGANAPWKKYRREAFLQKLRGGSALIINALPLSFCENATRRHPT